MTIPLSADLRGRMDAYWRAASYLPIGLVFLQYNPLLEEPLKREHIKPRLTGALGHDHGPQFSLRAFQPPDRRERPQHDLRHRPGTRRAGTRGAELSRRFVYGAIIGHRARSQRHAAACPAILLALWRAQPRRAVDARLDPRGRRTRLFARARLCRGVRRSESARRRRLRAGRPPRAYGSRSCAPHRSA